MIKVEGLSYHERTKTLHLRVINSEVLEEVTKLLRDLHGATSKDAAPDGILETQSLHLSIGGGFLQPTADPSQTTKEGLSLIHI